MAVYLEIILNRVCVFFVEINVEYKENFTFYSSFSSCSIRATEILVF